MRLELKAQAAMLADQGIKISHWDGHQNKHLWPLYFEAASRIAARFDIPGIRSHRRQIFTNTGPLSPNAFARYYRRNPKRAVLTLAVDSVRSKPSGKVSLPQTAWSRRDMLTPATRRWEPSGINLPIRYPRVFRRSIATRVFPMRYLGKIPSIQTSAPTRSRFLRTQIIRLLPGFWGQTSRLLGSATISAIDTEESLRIVAVGDIMLGRGMNELVESGPRSPLPQLAREMTGDIVTGNLKCLIGAAGSPSLMSHSHFQGDPAFSQSLMRRFDVVTMANNHAGDFGDAAIDETIAWLTHVGVSVVGIGHSLDEAIAPATFRVGKCQVAVFGATTVGTLTASSRYVLAKPGAALQDRARQFIEDGYTCVLHLHGGGGDFEHPSPGQGSYLSNAAMRVSVWSSLTIHMLCRVSPWMPRRRSSSV